MSGFRGLWGRVETLWDERSCFCDAKIKAYWQAAKLGTRPSEVLIAMPDKITKCFLGPSNKLLPESDRIRSRPTGKSEITTDMCAEYYEDTTCPTFYERLYRCVVQYVVLSEFQINLLLYRASQQLNGASSISVPLVSTVSAWCIVRKKNGGAVVCKLFTAGKAGKAANVGAFTAPFLEPKAPKTRYGGAADNNTEFISCSQVSLQRWRRLDVAETPSDEQISRAIFNLVRQPGLSSNFLWQIFLKPAQVRELRCVIV